MAHLKRFTATSRNNACQICGDTRGKCRQIEALHLCMQITEAWSTPPGFKFIGMTKDNLWGKFIVKAESTQSQSWELPSHAIRKQQQQSEVKQQSQVLSSEERDRHYRQLLNLLSLHTADRTDLHKRGLTDEQIELWGVKSVKQWQQLSLVLPHTLPGVNLKGDALNVPAAGYLCPIQDVKGKLVGFQIRLREGDTRYLWLTSATKKHPIGAKPHLANGELPLAVHRPQKIERATIALVEGVGAKPFITAQRRQQVTIGAAGGQFASSPQTLKETLDALFQELNTKTIEFYPDAGAVHNHHVMRQYRATWKLLRQWGYEVQIAWWGQETKACDDVDELATFNTIRWLSTAQFEAIAHPKFGWLEQITRTLVKKQSPVQAAIALRTRLHEHPAKEYAQGQRIQVWQAAIQQGYRYILDSSAPGTGKSYDCGRVEPSTFNAQQVLYACDQHRNPTVETLGVEHGWTDLEARHSGLVRETTPGGGTRLKRAGQAETPSISANCNRTQVISTLRSKHVNGADTASLICSTCPLREPCIHSEGTGYGFLNQRQSALSSPKLRAHLDSLPNPLDYALSETILLLDEPGQTFRTKQDILISLQDLEQVILRLVEFPTLFESLQPLLVTLLPLLDGSIRLKRFGIAHPDLVKQLPHSTVDLSALTQALHPDLSFLNSTAEYGVDLGDLPRFLRKKFAERDDNLSEQAQQRVLKQWLPEMLKILDGTIVGASMQLGYRGLTLSLPYSRHRSLVQASKATIFLDATLHIEDLALKLGCQANDIFVCRQKSPTSDNLHIMQVIDLGRLGMQRGASQQKRVQAIVSHLQNQDPTTKVIDFKKFAERDFGQWWRDSRGVNDFEQTRRLILIGTPCRNLADLQTEYAGLTGQFPTANVPEFRAMVDRTIQAEFSQAIGRLRAYRRAEIPLEVIILSDFKLDIPTHQINASSITFNAATAQEQLTMAMQGAIEQLRSLGQKVTQSAIARMTGYSQQHLSRHRKLLQMLLEFSNSNQSKPEDLLDSPCNPVADVLNEVLENNPTPAQVLGTVNEVFFDWLEPDRWEMTWRQLNTISQVKLLAVLLLALPISPLDKIVSNT